jgi:hypothetical protein
MFIAQVDEMDTYDANGQRINDINSLTEYISEIILGHHDPSHPDEDDDNARYFHMTATTLYDFQQYKMNVPEDLKAGNKKAYAFFKENKWLSPFLEINSPPPKA